jgi:hypothetical protein
LLWECNGSKLAHRAHKKEAALWPGALPCSRSAHSGLFVEALEDRVLARRAQSEATRPLAAGESQGWSVPGHPLREVPIALRSDPLR